MDDIEGRDGVKRVEAFSDGVIAIIVTIMVLELHAPEEPGLGRILALWPVFLAYLLSFAYVAIYWVNHHRLFGHARHVTNGLLWSNIALLFTLSLVPFATAHLGEQRFTREATLVYMAVLLIPSIAYRWVQASISGHGRHDAAAARYFRAAARKGLAASLIYLVGLALAFVSPAAGLACAALVALCWCLPSSRLDALFAR